MDAWQLGRVEAAKNFSLLWSWQHGHNTTKPLEMAVCEQMTDFLESNKLLPENQHGFRSKRSTMSAWAQIPEP